MFDDVDSEVEEGDGDERSGGEDREERVEGEDGLGRQDVNDGGQTKRKRGRAARKPTLHGRVHSDHLFEDAVIAEERRQQGQEGCVAD